MGDNKHFYKLTEFDKIPEKWKLVILEETIDEIKNGFASGKRDENGIVQIRMNNVTTDGRLIFDFYLKVPTPENINLWLLKKGDFLFNNTNSIDLVGKSTIFNDAPFPCTFSNHFTRIRFKKELVLPELILYRFLILWEKGYFKSVAIRHVGQSAVHTDYLLRLQIPLPPLPEQRRIAEVLGTVDSAIQKVGGAIERTERLKKGLMQRLLTRGIGHEKFKFSKELGAKIPEEWETTNLGEITKVMVGYVGPITEFYVTEGDKIPLLSTTNVSENGIKLEELKYVTPEFHRKNKKSQIFPGDLIIARHGISGSAAIIPNNLKEAQCLNVVIVRHSEKFESEFIGYLFNSKSIRDRLIGWKSGSVQGVVNTKVLEILKIPLPPLPEQRRIAEILSTVDRKLELERRRKEKLERVKKGLMNDLLTGRKRVKVS